MWGFLRLDDGYLVKFYEHKDDWQIIDSMNNERWSSKWHNDKEGSLKNAIDRFFEHKEITYELKDFEIIER